MLADALVYTTALPWLSLLASHTSPYASSAPLRGYVLDTFSHHSLARSSLAH